MEVHVLGTAFRDFSEDWSMVETMSRRSAGPSKGLKEVQLTGDEDARSRGGYLIFVLLRGFPKFMDLRGGLLVSTRGARGLAEVREDVAFGQHAADAGTFDIRGFCDAVLEEEAVNRGEKRPRVGW